MGLVDGETQLITIGEGERREIVKHAALEQGTVSEDCTQATNYVDGNKYVHEDSPRTYMVDIVQKQWKRITDMGRLKKSL